ncbi:DUF1045 domain-containing protein [Polaromonas sp. YR568]|uniref:DUF1045 domain-containing protein n=1 Tax=Polaromonas sp. YR568 TaxID=1855301 RepID=UPI0031377D76
MSTRYAIYFAPDKPSPWWRLGAHWLGRDEHDNAPLPQPGIPDMPGIPAPSLASITTHPRRYGFHATLKAPFRLSAGHQEQDLMARLGQLARTLAPSPLGPMQVTRLDSFVALAPVAQTSAVNAIEAACVTQLDDLRAPLTPAELARRNPDQLDAHEAELLARYGYPHVLDRFRLHMTLTDPVDADTANAVIAALAPEVNRLNQTDPLVLDRLCLFVEREPGANFQRLLDVRLPS